MTDVLDHLEPGDVPVWEPTDNCTIKAHGLADNSAGPIMFNCEATTDDGQLASIRTLTLVDADEDTFYVSEIDGLPARHVHDAIHGGIEASGGSIIDPNEHE